MDSSVVLPLENEKAKALRSGPRFRQISNIGYISQEKGTRGMAV